MICMFVDTRIKNGHVQSTVFFDQLVLTSGMCVAILRGIGVLPNLGFLLVWSVGSGWGLGGMGHVGGCGGERESNRTSCGKSSTTFVEIATVVG